MTDLVNMLLVVNHDCRYEGEPRLVNCGISLTNG